jgi:hypothetical protein
VGRGCRCFGSNYRIDPEAVMDDLIQTLDRMQIKPIGRESVNRSFSEHRRQWQIRQRRRRQRTQAGQSSSQPCEQTSTPLCRILARG